MSEMEKLIRETKGLHFQQEDVPPWAALEHSPPQPTCGRDRSSSLPTLLPLTRACLHISSPLKLLNFAEVKRSPSTWVIKKKKTFIETQHDNTPLSPLSEILYSYLNELSFSFPSPWVIFLSPRKQTCMCSFFLSPWVVTGDVAVNMCGYHVCYEQNFKKCAKNEVAVSVWTCSVPVFSM